MTDREKLIDLFYESNVRCDQGIEDLADDVLETLAHGVTVREPQKPLMLEELSDETDMYWVENEDGCFPVLLWDKSYCFSTFSQFGTEQDVELNNDDYGKTWRCWAEKPTEEERMAALWE